METVVATASLGADLLYRVPLGDGFSAYGGVGPGILFLPLSQAYALCGALGIEYGTGRVGFFSEVQPLLTRSDFGLDYGRLRTGVNFSF